MTTVGIARSARGSHAYAVRAFGEKIGLVQMLCQDASSRLTIRLLHRFSRCAESCSWYASSMMSSMSSREKRISEYFTMWVTRDFSGLDGIFAQNCVYEECYGPIYQNLHQIKRWIDDMLRKQIVSTWTIHEFFHSPEVLTVTWTFAASEGTKSYEFDGASIIHFNYDNLIDHVQEFESKHERTHPYA